MPKFSLVFLAVAVSVCAISADDEPVVCLEKGCVRGKSFKGNLKEFEGFLGIPYAKPPVGELRLKVSHEPRCILNYYLIYYSSRVKLKKV